MDNNKSIQFGSQYRNIDKTIRNYRKNQTLFVISMVVTNALIIAFLTIYYSIRQHDALPIYQAKGSCRSPLFV